MLTGHAIAYFAALLHRFSLARLRVSASMGLLYGGDGNNTQIDPEGTHTMLILSQHDGTNAHA